MSPRPPPQLTTFDPLAELDRCRELLASAELTTTRRAELIVRLEHVAEAISRKNRISENEHQRDRAIVSRYWLEHVDRHGAGVSQRAVRREIEAREPQISKRRVRQYVEELARGCAALNRHS